MKTDENVFIMIRMILFLAGNRVNDSLSLCTHSMLDSLTYSNKALDQVEGKDKIVVVPSGSRKLLKVGCDEKVTQNARLFMCTGPPIPEVPPRRRDRRSRLGRHAAARHPGGLSHCTQH